MQLSLKFFLWKWKLLPCRSPLRVGEGKESFSLCPGGLGSQVGIAVKDVNSGIRPIYVPILALDVLPVNLNLPFLL